MSRLLFQEPRLDCLVARSGVGGTRSAESRRWSYLSRYCSSLQAG